MKIESMDNLSKVLTSSKWRDMGNGYFAMTGAHGRYLAIPDGHPCVGIHHKHLNLDYSDANIFGWDPNRRGHKKDEQEDFREAIEAFELMFRMAVLWGVAKQPVKHFAEPWDVREVDPGEFLIVSADGQTVATACDMANGEGCYRDPCPIACT